jgi:hypothetical protein
MARLLSAPERDVVRAPDRCASPARKHAGKMFESRALQDHSWERWDLHPVVLEGGCFTDSPGVFTVNVPVSDSRWRAMG